MKLPETAGDQKLVVVRGEVDTPGVVHWNRMQEPGGARVSECDLITARTSLRGNAAVRMQANAYRLSERCRFSFAAARRIPPSPCWNRTRGTRSSDGPSYCKGDRDAVLPVHGDVSDTELVFVQPGIGEPGAGFAVDVRQRGFYGRDVELLPGRPRMGQDPAIGNDQRPVVGQPPKLMWTDLHGRASPARRNSSRCCAPRRHPRRSRSRSPWCTGTARPTRTRHGRRKCGLFAPRISLVTFCERQGGH